MLHHCICGIYIYYVHIRSLVVTVKLYCQCHYTELVNEIIFYIEAALCAD